MWKMIIDQCGIQTEIVCTFFSSSIKRGHTYNLGAQNVII